MFYTKLKVVNNINKYKKDSKFYMKRMDILIEDMSLFYNMEHFVEWAPSEGFLTPIKLIPIFDDSSVSTSTMAVPTSFTMELTNPTKKLLNALGFILLDVRYSIAHIEIAYDINTPSNDKAIDLLLGLSKNIVFTLNGRTPTFHKDASGRYERACFGTEEDNCAFEMYVPAPGETIYGDTSVHTKIILNGTDVVREHGFWTIADLVSLNLANWYKSNILIYAVVKHRVGEIYCQDTKQPVPTAKECKKIYRREFGTLASLHQLYHEGDKYRSALRDHRLIDWNIEEEWS